MSRFREGVLANDFLGYLVATDYDVDAGYGIGNLHALEVVVNGGYIAIVFSYSFYAAAGLRQGYCHVGKVGFNAV
jgi:predicted Co/Zn/Cd cation transporter (cation efflux family)